MLLGFLYVCHLWKGNPGKGLFFRFRNILHCECIEETLIFDFYYKLSAFLDLIGSAKGG